MIAPPTLPPGIYGPSKTGKDPKRESPRPGLPSPEALPKQGRDPIDRRRGGTLLSAFDPSSRTSVTSFPSYRQCRKENGMLSRELMKQKNWTRDSTSNNRRRADQSRVQLNEKIARKADYLHEKPLECGLIGQLSSGLGWGSIRNMIHERDFEIVSYLPTRSSAGSNAFPVEVQYICQSYGNQLDSPSLRPF
ncbi:hypothetical protein Acr_00g0002020 [Actinidia rufa]|uniref:Uncharacterized protein n=1 Tax=Actinidia rufa TaxID=165716 RepID=A0A7J0D6H6_9ERIC|nr:hypothetical protein Acr_00g0000960 [Actinidia rufa]GFS28484.1 hypothetical protein Acr_00g0002020 [Actinidia rufa]